MSRENVEVVRRIYEEWGRGNLRAGVELYDPHVMLVLRAEFPHPGVYVGPHEIARYMRDLLADFTDFAIAGKDFIDAGDTVVVEVLQTGGGPTSQALTGMRYFQVWTFRGDAVIRIESIRERADALAAAGLE